MNPPNETPRMPFSASSYAKTPHGPVPAHLAKSSVYHPSTGYFPSAYMGRDRDVPSALQPIPPAQHLASASAPAFPQASAPLPSTSPSFRAVRCTKDLDESELQSDWYSAIDDVDKEGIEQAWNLFSIGHPGSMGFYELEYALHALGFELQRADIKSWIDQYGRPPMTWPPPHWPPHKPCPTVRLELSLDQFRHIAACLIAFRDPREFWEKAFRIMDADGDGLISQDDLRLVSDQVGRDLTDEDIRRMILEADIDERGGVELEEFCVLMERRSAKQK